MNTLLKNLFKVTFVFISISLYAKPVQDNDTSSVNKAHKRQSFEEMSVPNNIKTFENLDNLLMSGFINNPLQDQIKNYKTKKTNTSDQKSSYDAVWEVDDSSFDELDPW